MKELHTVTTLGALKVAEKTDCPEFKLLRGGGGRKKPNLALKV